LFQRKEFWEPKEQMLKLTSRGRVDEVGEGRFQGCNILPERSTNTTTGFVLFGRLNLGTRVTMRAFELGCISCSAAGEERQADLMMRMKSLSSSVMV